MITFILLTSNLFQSSIQRRNSLCAAEEAQRGADQAADCLRQGVRDLLPAPVHHLQHEAAIRKGQEARQVHAGRLPQETEVPGAWIRGQDPEAHPQAAVCDM